MEHPPEERLAQAILKLLYNFFESVRSPVFFPSKRDAHSLRTRRIAYFYMRNRRRYQHLLEEYVEACTSVYGGKLDCMDELGKVMFIVIRRMERRGVEPFRTLYEVLRSDVVDTNLVRAILAPYVRGEARLAVQPA